MEARAVTRYIRIAPRKVRGVIDTVRYKDAKRALYILSSLNKRAARIAERTLKSAIANARVKKMDEDRLYISEIKADTGPSFKRYMARAMSRADLILRRTTHLTVALKESEKKGSDAAVDKKAAGEAAKKKTKLGKAKTTKKKTAKAKGA